ncbi:MAG: pyruvate dehydrogenase complex dihydrolipoamide acetyltransferase [Bacteroidetes bacterium]|jgi:pyruvate dehydrogenase E2 component (dihydrolipoamide acetyltransferase)|nr:pyruvate dehydrogenase complex dihydrolipoamide acetyltransferase [Bacteroidota bacterium]
MAEIVRMPKMSDTMTEGVVAKWHKKVGDTIKSGDLVAEIETDKATMEFESYQSGTLLYIGVPEGKAGAINSVLAILGAPGEDYKPLLAEEEKTSKEEKPAAAKKEDTPAPKTESKPTPKAETKPEPKPTVATTTSSDSRIKASPLARSLAEQQGIDLSKIKGSGDNGRIVRRDIDWFKPGSYVAGGKLTSAFTQESFEELPVSQMRKTIARRLSESKFTAPHFYLTLDIEMTRCMEARETINAATGSKISFNDFVIKACATALQQHPKVNSSWLGDTIRINHHINIGVAVAVEEGLLVPVVRYADSKTLTQINGEVKEFAQKAKDKKLQPADWEGNTFTISNLGMFDIEEFTAIINPPDACILAVGAIKAVPVIKNGQVVAGNVMRITLSCDHRVVDGVTGAKFLNTVKGFLENPVLLLGQSAI